jgi:hypothetical protein
MSYVWQEDKLSNQPRLLQHPYKDLREKERSKLINRMVIKSK